MSNKWITISARVTNEEKEIILQRAEDCGMNFNEYIRSRLLYDQDDSNNSKAISQIDKRNYVNICKTYSLVRSIALKQFNNDKEKLKNIELPAINNAIEKDLIPNDFNNK